MDENEIIHRLTLYILDVFIKFCEENDLRYYFTGGALIGVLRHKGFIPWDDDIDLGMPRKDYDRAQELLKNNMPSGFGIVNRYTDLEWHFAMSQFVDLESEIEVHLAEKTRKTHVWIDIFPLDGLPSNYILRWFRVKTIMLYRYLVQIANIRTQVEVKNNRPIFEKVVLFICKMLPTERIINSGRMLDRLDNLLRKSDYDTSEWCGNMLGRYREKEVVKREWFGNPVTGIFENRVVNIPENSDAIQHAIYGDYMQLPPEADRKSHNVSIIKSRELME